MCASLGQFPKFRSLGEGFGGGRGGGAHLLKVVAVGTVALVLIALRAGTGFTIIATVRKPVLSMLGLIRTCLCCPLLLAVSPQHAAMRSQKYRIASVFMCTTIRATCTIKFGSMVGRASMGDMSAMRITNMTCSHICNAAVCTRTTNTFRLAVPKPLSLSQWSYPIISIIVDNAGNNMFVLYLTTSATSY